MLLSPIPCMPLFMILFVESCDLSTEELTTTDIYEDRESMLSGRFLVIVICAAALLLLIIVTLIYFAVRGGISDKRGNIIFTFTLILIATSLSVLTCIFLFPPLTDEILSYLATKPIQAHAFLLIL